MTRAEAEGKHPIQALRETSNDSMDNIRRISLISGHNTAIHDMAMRFTYGGSYLGLPTHPTNLIPYLSLRLHRVPLPHPQVSPLRAGLRGLRLIAASRTYTASPQPVSGSWYTFWLYFLTCYICACSMPLSFWFLVCPSSLL